MNSPMVRFALTFTVYSLIAHGIGYTLVHEWAPKFILELKYYIVTVLFFFFMVLLAHRLITNTDSKNPQQFVRNFMAATALKLFLYFGIMIVWVLLNRGNAGAIIVSVVMIYFFNIVFDTIHLLKRFKKNAEKAV